MTDGIKPALTPRQWGLASDIEELTGHFTLRITLLEDFPNEADIRRHGVAALALYGEPFGFTRAHLEALRSVGRQNPDGLPGYGVPIHEIADRIEALLPPEEPK